jgi:hypothetical protein
MRCRRALDGVAATVRGVGEISVTCDDGDGCELEKGAAMGGVYIIRMRLPLTGMRGSRAGILLGSSQTGAIIKLLD